MTYRNPVIPGFQSDPTACSLKRHLFGDAFGWVSLEVVDRSG
jgi:hypothetical protein